LGPELAAALGRYRRALGMPDPANPGPSLPPRPTAAAIAACHRDRRTRAQEQRPVADLAEHRLRTRAEADRRGIAVLTGIAHQGAEHGEVAA
jgi:hypothetical protein